MTPSVCVIIPIYAVTSFLDEAIRSVLAQDIPSRIIVVNDGSDVQSSARIAAICGKHPGIILINRPHEGAAAAREAGFRQANEELVLFLDADDRLLPGALKRLVHALQTAPAAIASYGLRLKIDEQGEILDTPAMPREPVSGLLLNDLLRGLNLLSNGSICMRRSALNRISFPHHLRQGEDWVTWCRLAALGEIVYIGGEPVLAVRMHKQNVSNQVLDHPPVLTPMLDTVYQDQAFISLIGQKPLARYRRHHLHRIHRYLRYSYARRQQSARALKHRILAWAYA